MPEGFSGRRILVVGGAGFVGSNLCHALLGHDPAEIVIVDNLLSAVQDNVPEDERVTLVQGSINEAEILASLPEDLDYAFHLATYHGNQSSIHDPIADHRNNLITTLKLLNHARDFKRLKKLVYSGAGCAAAKKTFDEPDATTEDAALSFEQDSPYSISKLVGEFCDLPL